MAAAVLEVWKLGRTRYADAHALQERIVGERIQGARGDTLLFTEHEPIVTVGRKLTGAADVAVPGIATVAVERGGEATFHGPGQIVGYPILALSEGRRDLHRYLRDLEEVVIRALSDFGVEGRRASGLTGVWIGARKVCSLGVAVRQWVTWHGFALNVHTELDAFRAFRPCGLDPDVMTRLSDHVAAPVHAAEVERRLETRFAEVFGYDEIARRGA